MVKIIAIVIAALIASVLAYAATRPDTFHVQRSANIRSSPEKIFPLIIDFKEWRIWSPYENIDPRLKRTYSGSATGKGAVYEWEGNSKVGSGRIEIVDAVPPSKVTLQLDMFKPMEGHNIVEFTLNAEGNATYVTWVMDGRTGYIAKVISLFVSMDNMIGGQFEKGLASLKALSEK